MDAAGRIVRLALVTAGGAGLVPKAPGTCGSLVALLLIAFFPDGPWYSWCTAGAAVAASALCVALGPFAERHFHRKDPEPFVLDEVAGMLVSLFALSKPPLHWCAAAFALFRWLDIAKPFGIRRIQRWPSGWGILADDLAAGLVALGLVTAARGLAALGGAA